LAVDVDELLRSLADMLHRTLDQRIRIEVDVPSERLLALADPGQLESALLNIAINARDAMPDGGTLRFRAAVHATVPEDIRAEMGGPHAPDGGFVAIAIEDSGSGMTDETKARAFEPFFTTKEAGRGTGLGLSTVYGFVKQSKGAVTLASAVGTGTTVTLYIPRPAQAAAPATEGQRRDRLVPPGLRLLLVEDDAEVRVVVQRFLESMRCEVTLAASGEQALLALGHEARFDMLVTDIALGAGIRGTELAARAQARFPDLAILLMSGYSSELLDADRESPAAWELLRKPCTREELAQAVARALGVD
jgi:CheY-like chemotaxis protein